MANVGCGLPLAERGALLDNSCQSDSDCGPDGVCSANGICISNHADLDGLIVQIEVPQGAPYGPGTSSLTDISGLLYGSDPNGFVRQHALVTDEIVSKTFSLSPTFDPIEPFPADCEELLKAKGTWETDRTFPIVVELYPVEVAGIPLTVYSAQSDSSDGTNAVVMNVPNGQYRVYMRPLIDDPETEDVEYPDCRVPPALFTADVDPQSTPLTMPTTVGGTINTNGLDIGGWTLDIVDRDSGRLISTRITIPEAHSATLDFRATGALPQAPLVFWNEVAVLQGLKPLVRLTPDEASHDRGMPVLYWYLDAVAFDGYDNISLDLAPFANAVPVTITGRVFDPKQNEDVSATVVVQLQKGSLFDGTYSETVGYKRTLTTDPGVVGQFEVTLLPGKYDVIAKPGRDDLAISTSVWAVTSVGGNRTVEVYPKAQLGASQVLTPQGNVAYGVPVFAAPSGGPVESFSTSQDSSDVQQASATTATQADGGFRLDLDPGSFDVSIRPPTSATMPWRIVPRVLIELSEEGVPMSSDLGQIRIGYPVVLQGNVFSPTNAPIGGARIRAWLPLDPREGDQGATAVQIAETTARADGSYQLLLPPSISR